MASSSGPAPSPSLAASALQPPSPAPPASDLQVMHAIAADPAPLHTPPAHPLCHRFSSSPARLPPRGADDSAGLSAAGGSSPSCRPAAMPARTQPPPFLTKTYDLVDDTDTDAVISWNTSGSGFIVWDSQGLCQQLLPRYFRHGNFASFVRQLNTYGFRKIDPKRWEFANDDFVRGKRSLLGSILRKKPAGEGTPHHYHHHHHQLQHAVGLSASGMLGAHSEASILKVGRVGFREELNGLKREACKLEHQVQHSEAELQTMRQRLQMSSNCEQHMMAFIIKATRDPSFLSQLVQQPSSESSDMPKRQRSAGPMASSVEGGDRTMGVDCTSAVCDAPNSSARLQEGLETQHSMNQLDAANHRKMPMPPSPYRLALQNEACLMMAAGNLITQAD